MSFANAPIEPISFLHMNFLEELRRVHPPIFSRETASQMVGGIFSSRALSNFDAAGTGPINKCHIGKKVAYRREEFVGRIENMMGVE